MLLGKRVLTACLLCLVVHDLFLWWEAGEAPGLANLFCNQHEFPPVAGPSGYAVTADRTDCLFRQPSITSVYLHSGSRGLGRPTLSCITSGTRPAHPGSIPATS